ncbi:hypothetical protein HFD88_008425 [Aspergillus terreus]|nr:hypothetical protein HFD88_008425 [Aspergillus terreus]
MIFSSPLYLRIVSSGAFLASVVDPHFDIRFRNGYLCARQTTYNGSPSPQAFDDHLSWTYTPTPFPSFSSSWRRALRVREKLESDRQTDIVVIAVWAQDLLHVYSAEDAARTLEYSDWGSDPQRRLDAHEDEYLVEGGIAADEYRILAVFEGGGPERTVVFESQEPSYRITTSIPGEFFPGLRSGNALRDIEDEIYRRSGRRDCMKRDELVKAIARTDWTLQII